MSSPWFLFAALFLTTCCATASQELCQKLTFYPLESSLRSFDEYDQLFWTQDSKGLYTVHNEEIISWDIDTRESIKNDLQHSQITSHIKPVAKRNLHPLDTTLSVTRKDGTIHVVKTTDRTEKILYSYTFDNDRPHTVSWSPNGKKLAVICKQSNKQKTLKLFIGNYPFLSSPESLQTIVIACAKKIKFEGKEAATWHWIKNLFAINEE